MPPPARRRRSVARDLGRVGAPGRRRRRRRLRRARSRTPTGALRPRGPARDCRMPSTTRRRNAVRCSKRSAVAPGSVDCAEQLVEQVAVAVLHVDEVEAGVGGQHRGGHVRACDQRVELVVGEDDRVVDRRPRRRAPGGGRRSAAATCRSARDHRPEWVSCRPTTRPSALPCAADVRVDQLGAQRRRASPTVAGRARAGGGWRARRAARRPPRRPTRAWRRSRRSAATAGARGRWADRRPRRPSPPWAARRTGCRPCASRPSRR